MLTILISHPIIYDHLIAATFAKSLARDSNVLFIIYALVIAFILPFVIYLISCFILSTIIKTDKSRKVFPWEKGMFIGMIVSIFAFPILLLFGDIDIIDSILTILFSTLSPYSLGCNSGILRSVCFEGGWLFDPAVIVFGGILWGGIIGLVYYFISIIWRRIRKPKSSNTFH